MQTRRTNTVFRSLNRPLTILGVERKLFFFALLTGAGVFNLMKTLLGGILMFLLLYFIGRWATKTDPQIFRFFLNSGKTKSQYDPMKFSSVRVRRINRV